jgi:hypothetical protein
LRALKRMAVLLGANAAPGCIKIPVRLLTGTAVPLSAGHVTVRREM